MRRYLLALPFAALLIWLGLRNHTDPLWIEAGELLRAQPVLLSDSPDSLQTLYARIHATTYRPGDSTAWKIVLQPGSSAIEWAPFARLCETAMQQKKLVIGGVTGTGATKYAKHLGRLLAGDPQRMMLIECAPQFDLELHRKYIGQEGTSSFQPGQLLRFWEDCRRNPTQQFVLVLDNFDKINPETFFGPELWETLSSSTDSTEINGYPVRIPANFFLLSVTHLGPGSLIEMNEEHFKRLGRLYPLDVNPRELLVWLRLQEKSLASRQHLTTDDSLHLAALRSPVQMQRFLFSFLKANDILCQRYGQGFELGQGSPLRQLYTDADLPVFLQAVYNHLRALLPGQAPDPDMLDAINFSIRTNGLQPGSNFFARQIQFLQETGYLVEITMVATTALLTALAGWWVFRRREQLMRLYGDRAQEVFSQFEKQEISAETAARRLEAIKTEVDDLVMSRKLNYTEALYFLAFIEDKVKRIEFARNVSENFLELFNTFMEDNILTEGEYLKLMQFLQSMRHKIPEETYNQFHNKVQQTFHGPLMQPSETKTAEKPT